MRATKPKPRKLSKTEKAWQSAADEHLREGIDPAVRVVFVDHSRVIARYTEGDCEYAVKLLAPAEPGKPPKNASKIESLLWGANVAVHVDFRSWPQAFRLLLADNFQTKIRFESAVRIPRKRKNEPDFPGIDVDFIRALPAFEPDAEKKVADVIQEPVTNTPVVAVKPATPAPSPQPKTEKRPVKIPVKIEVKIAKEKIIKATQPEFAFF